MLQEKKRKGHAEVIDEPNDDPAPIDFAWVILIGMKIGYTEKEIAHMHFGKWCELYEAFQNMHNLEMNRGIFEKKQITSILDL